MKLKALIVDDEPHARKLLEVCLLEKCTNVAVVGTASDTRQARALIEEFSPDLVFLDIEMPEESGLEFLIDYEERNFYPIIVTSHAEYAIEAIRIEAFDYLLKPLDPQELENSVERIRKRLQSNSGVAVGAQEGKISLKNVSNITYLNIAEILAVKAAGSYSEVCTKEGVHVVSHNLKYFENMLESQAFLRVHNSHIVNLKQVTKFIHQGNYAVLKNGDKFVVSNSKKEEFKRRMSSI